jgi:Fe-S cluster biosynthesis and repair protein YggX
VIQLFKITAVAIEAIPIKKKMLINPNATKVPKQEARKFLKKSMTTYFISKIGFVELFYEI